MQFRKFQNALVATGQTVVGTRRAAAALRRMIITARIMLLTNPESYQ